MWELVNRFSHGRISVRRISLLAVTGLMTFLVAAFTLSAPAYADDATRTGTSVKYQDKTFTPLDPAKDLPPALASQNPVPTGYRYIDTSANKAHFILTTGDPAQANSGYYVIYDFTPPANYSNPSPPVDITFVAENADGEVTVEQCGDTSLTGIGWFICPAANFIAISMDKIYGVIADFLVVRTVTANMESPLFQLWAVIRDIANICFVIAILIIVYSQLTSIGISNYGLKKTLPRLIIAAILVNISFWICTIAVDASNILGYSIHSMFMGLIDKFSIGANYDGNANIPTWEQVTLLALAGTGVAVGGYTILATTVSGSLPLLLPFLVGGILAVLVALIVLAARQALITVFIIISPLAFVAYVLPNTEKWFTKWRETLTTLLLLFPIFSVVFSGAQLAGIAIIQSAGGNLFTIILGLATQVAPIVVTPLLVKFSGGLIGKIAGLVNNPNKGLVDRTRKWAEGVSQEQKNKILADQNRMNRFNGNPATRLSKAINKRQRYVAGRRKAYEAAADNWFDDTNRGQQVKTMDRDFSNDKKDIENRYLRSGEGRRTELRSRHLDVDKQQDENTLLRSGGGKYLTYRQGQAEVDKTRVHNEFEESSFGHKLDTAKRTVELEKKKIENTHQAEWDNKLRTDAGLLELDLNVKRSEVRASVAKEKLDKMHAEIVAQGHESEHILNLRGVDTATQDGMLNIAHDIREETLEASMAQTAKTMAERKITENKTKAIKENTILIEGKKIREYAAGLMEEAGERSIEAKAKSESSAMLIEDVKNIQSTMDYEVATSPDRIYKELKKATTITEKVAYAKAMAAAGTPGMKRFREVLSEIGDATAPDSIVTADELQIFKEFLSGEQSIRSAGKDIETYLFNKRGANAAGEPGKGELMTFDQLTADPGTWTNMSAVAFAGQSEVTQKDALNKLRTTDSKNYRFVLDMIRENPAALGSVKQSIRQEFSIYTDKQLKEINDGVTDPAKKIKIGDYRPKS